MKTDDADWVEDVRRWYFNGGRSASSADVRARPPRVEAGSVAPELGYEAAHPSLQSTSWSKPPASGFGTLS